VEALETIGVINQPVASIAKREEIIYVYGQEDEPIQLDHYSPVLHLIQNIRDEAHRFAVTFHRNRRSAARLTSELEQVEGIGPKTINKLLRVFGSLERVREAPQEELVKVIGPAAARHLREFYSTQATPEL
jgi:excinuclease ABC subunit C